MQFSQVQNEADWKQMYKERGETIREALKEKRRRGEATGMPPVGYRIVTGEDGMKRVEEDPVMGPLVQEARALHASGKYSLRQLLSILTSKGLRSRNGREMGISAFYNLINHAHPHLSPAKVRSTTSHPAASNSETGWSK